jgi:hypothetical protein
VPYKAATGLGADDGRCQEQECLKRRFSKPRLFQLMPRKSYSGAGHVFSPIHGGGSNKSNKKVSKRNRGGSQQSMMAMTKWDVLVKTFRSPWGENLGLGTTLDQRDADNFLMMQTRIFQFYCGSAHEDPPRCQLNVMAPAHHYPFSMLDNNNRISTTKDILNIMRIASRGKFLSQHHISDKHTVPVMSPYFCAPWLQPEVEWFSLPMYLASRFELALVDSYRIQRSQQHMPPIHSCLPSNLENAMSQASSQCLTKSIHTATVQAMVETLQNCEPSSRLLDTAIWKLLIVPESALYILTKDGHSTTFQELSLGLTPAEALCSAPLLLSGKRDNFFDFRLLVQKYVQLCLVKASEQRLLETIAESTKPALGASKKKKGKHKRNKKSGSARLVNKTPSVAVATVQEVADETDDDSENDEPDLAQMLKAKEASRDGAQRTVAQSSSSSGQGSGKVRMFALTIIEDIIEGACAQVGLPAESPNNIPVEPYVKSGEKTSMGQLQSVHEAFGILNGEQFQQDVFHHEGMEAIMSRIPGPDEFPPLAAGALGGSGVKIMDGGTTPVCGGVSSRRSSLSHLDPIYEPLESFDIGLDVDVSAGGVSLDLNGTFEGWKGLKPFPREKSLFAEFFELKDPNRQSVVASSTAASVASTMSDDAEVKQYVKMSDFELDSDDEEEEELIAAEHHSNVEVELPTTTQAVIATNTRKGSCNSPTVSTLSGCHLSLMKAESATVDPPAEANKASAINKSPGLFAATPSRPSSPIQVSLAELGELKKKANTEKLREELCKALPAAEIVQGSAPSSPRLGSIKIARTKSLSRENLLKPPTPLVSVRVAYCASKDSPPRSTPSNSLRRSESLDAEDRKQFARPAGSIFHTPHRQNSNPSLQRDKASAGGSDTADSSFATAAGRNHCAASVSALEDESSLNWGEDPSKIKSHQSQTGVGADESAIESVTAQSKSHCGDENASVVREQRNAFRDMCLTLGAEVSKLRNLLAAESCSHFTPVIPPSLYGAPPPPTYGYYQAVPPSMHPGFIQHYYNTATSAPGTVRVAMSDAGLTRGDFDSQRSEDGNNIDFSSNNNDMCGRQIMHAPMGDGGTVGGSDISIDFTGAGRNFTAAPDFGPQRPPGQISSLGIHSRLSADIFGFLDAVASQLEKTDRKRRTAISRFQRMVRALWPRAQVQMYGSHVSNLCLPNSDLDFVICLPAVHKNAPAVTPGVLEGRNAINETWQKLLARNLKGESWIDPRSIKIIERTAVPVIKVSTKDAVAKVLQLDISFDGPGHHGLEAIEMVKFFMEEFPPLRPLMLVLKQFLLDRGLLTAYTGGLSSYCLFLMLTRYLQEQSSSWGDVGSLLMGFLDFFGNLFDASTTGISVRRRQYFSRRDYAQPMPHAPPPVLVDQMWTIPQNQEPLLPEVAFPSMGLARRHSFTSNKEGDDKKKKINSPVKQHGKKPPRARSGSQNQNFPPGRQAPNNPVNQQHNASDPSTFDPLFVEDPLNANNNVGRNAFRIFQVKVRIFFCVVLLHLVQYSFFSQICVLLCYLESVCGRA